MAGGLEVPVSAPGLEQTSQGFDKLTRSSMQAAGGMVKTSDATSNLAMKLQSGGFVRNAAASFALLGSAAGGTSDKIAALSGILASVPGPIGLISAAVAAGATIFGIYGKSAEAAKKELEDLGKAIEALEVKRDAAQTKLANRLVGVQQAIGPEMAQFQAAGGSGKDLIRANTMFGGDSKAALTFSTELAKGKFTTENTDLVFGQVQDLFRKGVGSLESAVAIVKDARENVGGRAATVFEKEMFNSIRGSGPGGQGLDAVSVSRSGRSRDAYTQTVLAPEVAKGLSQLIDVQSTLSPEALDSLEAETNKNINATEDNTKELRRINADIIQQKQKRTEATRPARRSIWGALTDDGPLYIMDGY